MPLSVILSLASLVRGYPSLVAGEGWGEGKQLAGGYPKEVAAGGIVGADCWVEACDAALQQCFAYRGAFALEPSVIEFDAASKVESEMLAFCNYLLGMLRRTRTTFRLEKRHLEPMDDFVATKGAAIAPRTANEREVIKALRIPESLGRRLKVHTAWTGRNKKDILVDHF